MSLDDEEDLAQKSEVTNDEVLCEEASSTESQPAPTQERAAQDGQEGQEGSDDVIEGNTGEQFVNRLFMQRFRTMDMSRFVYYNCS